MKKYIYIACALLLIGCGGTKPQADGRYVRQPIVEVEQAQLDIEAMLIGAKTQQELGNTDEAMAAYRAILRKQPDYAPACYEMGVILLRLGSLDSALVYARAAVKGDPKNVWYLDNLAEAYRSLRDGKNWCATLEQKVKLCPDNLEYYYQLSDAYLQSRNYAASVEVLDRVERMVGITEMVSLQKYRIWDACGRKAQAQKELEALADAMPDDPKSSAILAENFMKEKKYDKAKKYYDRVLAASPNDEYIHISLASYHKAVGQWPEAYEELKKAFENPRLDDKTKVQVLASFYTHEEFYGSQSKYAFALFEGLMDRCQDPSEYALFYGDILMRQQQYRQAAEQFDIALQRDSSHYEVWESMLICLSESAPGDQILRYAHRAGELFPLHVLPFFLQGSVYTGENRFDEAMIYLEKCLKIGFPNQYLEAETYALLADCCYHTGSLDRAWKAYDHCLELKPDDAYLLNNYAYYLAERMGDLDKALRMAERALARDGENATFLDTYAWVLHRMGRDKDALKAILKALEKDPTNKTYINHKQFIEEGAE